MDNIPLGHLSRPQLVNLLLRIVDLLSQPLPQPVQPFPPAQATQAYPVLGECLWSRGEVSEDHQWYCTPSRTSEPGSDGPMVPGANCYHRTGGVSPLLNLHLASHILPKLTWLRLPWLARQRLIPKVMEVFLQVPTCFTTVPSQEVNLGN